MGEAENIYFTCLNEVSKRGDGDNGRFRL